MTDKYVKVMAEWCSDSVWTREGVMMDINDLPVSNKVIYHLGQWAYWHDARRYDDPIPAIDRFVAYGRRVAAAVKHDLPDWTVEYYDEQKQEIVEITEGIAWNESWKRVD
jgi:hypothetical protein